MMGEDSSFDGLLAIAVIHLGRTHSEIPHEMWGFTASVGPLGNWVLVVAGSTEPSLARPLCSVRVQRTCTEDMNAVLPPRPAHADIIPPR